MSELPKGFAPREAFETILEWAPIATFDVVVMDEAGNVPIVRRKIAPYAGKWALPGLRMLKGEVVDDTLQRITQQELGVKLPLDNKQILGQYVGKFATENQRQDISTGYLVPVEGTLEELGLEPNPAHFTGMREISDISTVPASTGAMYKKYLQLAFNQ